MILTPSMPCSLFFGSARPSLRPAGCPAVAAALTSTTTIALSALPPVVPVAVCAVPAVLDARAQLWLGDPCVRHVFDRFQLVPVIVFDEFARSLTAQAIWWLSVPASAPSVAATDDVASTTFVTMFCGTGLP